MRKVSFILFGLMLAFSVTAQTLVVATTTFLADIAKNIAGEDAKVVSLLPVGSDPHIYEPTPQDSKLVSGADLVVMNGLTLEGWIGKLVASSNPNAPIIIATDGVRKIIGGEHGGVDPHAWMDPRNGILYAKNIMVGLTDLLPEKKAAFEMRFKHYQEKLLSIDAEINTSISAIPVEKRILITSHDAFHYFGRAYGVRVEAAMGTSTDADVQTVDMARLSKIIDETHLGAIFVESTINPKMLEQLAKDKKVAIGGSLYADSLGDEQSGAGTYIGMLRHNAETIAKGLLGYKPEKNDHSSKVNGNLLLYGLIGGGFVFSFLIMIWKLR